MRNNLSLPAAHDNDQIFFGTATKEQAITEKISDPYQGKMCSKARNSLIFTCPKNGRTS
jgi:hypothetical protein